LTLRFLGQTFMAAMSSGSDTDNPPSRPSVFLSYASEDRSAASAIRDAMAAAGLDVWYDENELGGGDAWDKKIRRQIRECDYFMAVVSAQTEARHEGYFRREWRLAVERALDMADDHTFLLPVVIDGTDQSTARVPERFLEVQWLRLPAGQSTPALAALCSRLLSGTPLEASAPRRATTRSGGARTAPALLAMPAFPTEEPGQRVKFWVHVIGWALLSARVFIKRQPRWIRLLVYVWLFFMVVTKGCSRERHETVAPSPETIQKLHAIADKYKGSSNKDDVARLGMEIAHEFAENGDDSSGETKALLVEPFMDIAGSPAEAKLANTTFALLYGHLTISLPGKVALGKEPLAPSDIAGAVERGRAGRSNYVIMGGIANTSVPRALHVDIVKVSDGSVLWSKDYPATSADPATIAEEIGDKVPSLED
jgi:hypothetical protein